MKTSGQKTILKAALSIIILIGGKNLVFSQTATTPRLSSFLILVETTDNGIKLTGYHGCSFKELAFSLKVDKTQTIDQNGMSHLAGNKNVKDDILNNFIFMIKKTKEGITLAGIKGTAWENLSFKCPKGQCHQYIDEMGMTDEK